MGGVSVGIAADVLPARLNAMVTSVDASTTRVVLTADHVLVATGPDSELTGTVGAPLAVVTVLGNLLDNAVERRPREPGAPPGWRLRSARRLDPAHGRHRQRRRTPGRRRRPGLQRRVVVQAGGSARPTSTGRSGFCGPVRARSTPQSAGEIANDLGISRATAQRYLSDLNSAGTVELALRYGSTGRPEHQHSLREPGSTTPFTGS